MIQKEFIVSELKYRYPNLSNNILAPDLPVGRPLLFERGEKKFGARIIIATSEEMELLGAVNAREALFLCIGTPKREVLEQFDVCVLPEGEQASAVLNFVQRLFDRLDDWTQSLRQAAEEGEGVEALLTRASAMLQNPVVLLDARGHIIAHSDQAEVAGFHHYIRSNTLLEEVSENGGIEKLGSGSNTEVLRSVIRLGDSACALICLASERPLYASDEIVFDSLSGFLRLMLHNRQFTLGGRTQNPERDACAQAFCGLLLQDAPQQEATATLKKLGWAEEDDYAVLDIEPVDGNLRAGQADAICETIESAIKESCAFTLLPIITVIVRSSFLKNEEMMDSLRALASENGLRVGVCESFEGFAYLPQRLHIAKRALNRAEAFGGVARYFDLFEEELMAHALSEFPRELVCLRSIHAISIYDRAHESSYLKTAECYVKNRFNAVKTAGELFIHRSTFLYRLERMREQFGLDLEDPNLSLLHLIYSIRSVQD